TRGDQGRDQSAFAVANEADFPGVDLLAGFQISEGGFGIVRKVLHRGAGEVTCGLSDSAFIKAKNGDAFSRQVVRQDEKRTMPDERFIAVVRSGTADENGGGKRSRAAGKSERAC